MRYAILSDIHGNLPAWNTVLSDVALRDIDRIVCLGDVVGYGPEPAEVLKSVYEHVHLMVLGNHDAVVAGRMSAETFNDRAQRMIAWTSNQLGNKACEFFLRLPLVLKGENFRFVHGDFSDPGVFNYIETPEEALASFNAVPEPLLFCGHSHEAGLFVIGAKGVPHHLGPQDFTLEPGKRYIVNVGSVGFPRGGDPRASYVIFDEEAKTVRFFRLSYDFEAFRAAAARHGLGPDDIPMLRKAHVENIESVRETLDFSPATDRRATGDVVENDVSMLLKKSTARWKRIALATTLAGAVALAGAVGIALTSGGHAVSFPEYRASPVALASSVLPDGNCLPPLSPTEIGGFSALPFRIVLGDSRKQSASSKPLGEDGRACVAIRSDSLSEPVRFEAPDIECVAGDKIEVVAKAAFSDDFKGTVSLVAWLLREEGGEHVPAAVLMTKNFNNQVGLKDENLPVSLHGLPNDKGWWIARGTTEAIPPGGRFVRIELSGKFTGEVLIGGVAARRK